MSSPQCQIFTDNAVGLQKCAGLLENEDLVAVPSETVYGLAGNAFSEKAVRKIFEVKGRPFIDPLITHFKNTESAFAPVKPNLQAEKMADAFWPGPLTLILEKGPLIPDLVTAGLDSAAVRVPEQPAFHALLTRLSFPLAAPSANPFGYVSPTKAEHVQYTLGSKIAAILDGGPCRLGLESTVVDLRRPKEPRILRPGPLTLEEIEICLGCKIHGPAKSVDKKAQVSPGQLTQHYSPKTRIVVTPYAQTMPAASDKTATIVNIKPAQVLSEHVYWLSEDGDLDTIARNIFSLLQKLDRMNYELLSVEASPQSGIGVAVNDRLRRASAKC